MQLLKGVRKGVRKEDTMKINTNLKNKALKNRGTENLNKV